MEGDLIGLITETIKNIIDQYVQNKQGLMLSANGKMPYAGHRSTLARCRKVRFFSLHFSHYCCVAFCLGADIAIAA